ncbi:MAG: hypothetical protein ACYC5N_00130, partial [Endomicrobiales bacterium]
FLASAEQDKDFYDRATRARGTGMPLSGRLRNWIRNLLPGSRTGGTGAVVVYRSGVVLQDLGPVTDDGGRTYVAVTVKALSGKESGLKNTGMKVEINGELKAVRASASGEEFVLWVEGITGENREDVIRQINTRLSGTGNLRGSRRITRRVRGLLGLGNAALDPHAVIIDGASRGRTAYNSDGTTTVSADLFDRAIDRKHRVRMLGELLAVRKGEAFALARNIFVYLDSGVDLEHFKKELPAFNAMGSAQMILPESVFAGLKDRTIKEIARLARQNEVRIYIDATSDRFKTPVLGFGGHCSVATGEIHDFMLGDISGTVISGYTDLPGLEKAFHEAGGRAKILKFSELKSLKDGDERVLWAATITVLRTNVLRLFSPKAVTREHVRGVAYGLDWETIPAVEDFSRVQVAADSAGGELEGNSPVKDSAVGRYLDKLGRDTGNTPEAAALRKDFLEAIAERILVKDTLDRENFRNGLADTQLEQVLGRKLLQQRRLGTKGQGIRNTVIEAFDAMIRHDKSAAEVAAQLNAEVSALSGEADDAQAINTIIELIPRLGEPKILRAEEKAAPSFNARSVDALMKAA